MTRKKIFGWRFRKHLTGNHVQTVLQTVVDTNSAVKSSKFDTTTANPSQLKAIEPSLPSLPIVQSPSAAITVNELDSVAIHASGSTSYIEPFILPFVAGS